MQTERANRTLQAVLRSYAESRDDWDEWLPFVAAAYNSTVHESTGRTPFEMNFADARAIDPLQWAIGERDKVVDERGVSVAAERTLDEMKAIWDEVRAKLVVEDQARQKKYADTKRREVKYEVGDSVYLSTRNLPAFGGKLIAKWAGPYLVTEVKKSGVSVRLDLRGELGKTNPVFHVSQLKPYEVSELDWPWQTAAPPASTRAGGWPDRVGSGTGGGKEGGAGQEEGDEKGRGACQTEWRTSAEEASATSDRGDDSGRRASSVVQAEMEGLRG